MLDEVRRAAAALYEEVAAELPAPDVEALTQALAELLQKLRSDPSDPDLDERARSIGVGHAVAGIEPAALVVPWGRLRRAVGDVGGADEGLDRALAAIVRAHAQAAADRVDRHVRLATIGQLAASVGHDLRNPLGVIASSVFLLRRLVANDAKVYKHIDKIARQISICEGIIEDLMAVARDQPARPVLADPTALIGQAQESAGLPDAIEVAVSVDATQTLEVEVGLMRQAVMNLLVNASQAMSGAGKIVVEVAVDERWAVIEVHDVGPGFDADVLPTVFEPLVTTKASGAGLGLALVRSVAQRHGGSVQAGPSPHGGAVVTIRFPRRGRTTDDGA